MRVTTDALLEAAQANSLNIGTADHLARSVAPGGITPGELINWAIRMDPEELRSRATALERLSEIPDTEDGGYEGLLRSTNIDLLDDHWHGLGADAFVQRWNTLVAHIDSRSVGVKDRLLGQASAMHQLASDIDAFRNSILGAMDGSGADGISGVRAAYVTALCEEGEEAVVNQMLADSGLGATLGSAGGPKGVVIGGTVGALIGMIRGFADAAITRLEAITEQEVAARQLAAEWNYAGNALGLNDRSADGEITLARKEYKPGVSATGDPWDEVLEDDWETTT